MKVPIIDLVAAYEEQHESLEKAASDVLSSGYYVSGPKVKELEERLSTYLGTTQSIGVSNGTEALRLAIQAFGVGEGDEILTPDFTFFACSSTISLNNATPVFVDMNPFDFNMDIDDLQKRLTPNTKGIIAVHLYGHPARMPEILEIADRNGLFVIEDCAQSIGAEYSGKKTGSMGRLGTFSFYPTKNLHACGEAGIISSSDEELIEKIRLLRNHGESPRYHHHLFGVNSRMDELQAAFILVKFDLLEKWNNRRIEIGTRYNNELSVLPLTLPPSPDETFKSVYHAYTIRTERRDDLVRHLQSNEIGCMMYYPVPMHLQPVYKNLGYTHGDYPNAEKAAREVLSIPVHPYLDENQVDLVIKSIKDFFN